MLADVMPLYQVAPFGRFEGNQLLIPKIPEFLTTANNGTSLKVHFLKYVFLYIALYAQFVFIANYSLCRVE